MKYFRTVFLMLLCMAALLPLCSCGNDEPDSGEDSGTNGFAPDTLAIGNKISWDGYYYKENGETRYGESDCNITILNATDCKSNWSKDWGTYQYSKTSDNKAKLSFTIVQNVVGHVRQFNYNVTLEFTEKNKFKMTGSKTVYSNMVDNSYCDLHCEGTIE